MAKFRKKTLSTTIESTRGGDLYNAFPYPTKISSESIALMIACLTKPGDTILDSFGGSGSTAYACLLCEKPTINMIQSAQKRGLKPKWGPRNAILYEIGAYGSFASRTLSSRLSPEKFENCFLDFINKAQKKYGWMYAALSPDQSPGEIRHIIWSDVLTCPKCHQEFLYADGFVSVNPIKFNETGKCPHCMQDISVFDARFSTFTFTDKKTGEERTQKLRKPYLLYGVSNGKKWKRKPTQADYDLIERISRLSTPGGAHLIQWGDLYRSGYHFGIKYLHDFYTWRNYLIIEGLIALAQTYPPEIRDALILTVLSYNQSNATLMTRVVAKKDSKDFVLTSAQSGVLYISRLPVEKNILLGLARKAKGIKGALGMLYGTTGRVAVKQRTCTQLEECPGTFDFVFTDPPFGDFIPYAEINQINELFLENVTDRSSEIIISEAENKDVVSYGNLLQEAFSEIKRTLKTGHCAAVVFHSSKTPVWNAFCKAITNAGLAIVDTSVLDKKQGSFKQVVSEDSVKGDPIVFLEDGTGKKKNTVPEMEILRDVFQHRASNDVQMIYSTFVAECLLQNGVLSLSSKEANKIIREMMSHE